MPRPNPQDLFDLTPDPWCVIGRDHRLLRINAPFVLAFALREGDRFLDCVQSIDRHAVAEAMRTAFAQGRAIADCVRHVDPTGTLACSWHFFESGDQVFAAARDVTQLQAEIRRTRRERERVELAIENANCGLWDWDVQTGIAWFSPNVACMFGVREGETLPALIEAWEIRLHPEDHERVQRALAAHFLEFAPFDVEYRLRVGVESHKWFRSRGEVMRDLDGNPLRMTGSLIDIDAQKRIEHDLERARIAAEAASQAKSAFLANMSHEIRTPMNAILGFAELLRDETDLTQARRSEYLETIRRNGDHLLRVIEDVLDLSKIEADRIGIEQCDVDIPALVDELVTTLRVRAAAKHLPVSVVFASKVPRWVRTDPVRVRQILVNLLGNAIKFTTAGHVRLILALDQAVDQRPELRIRIEDSGIGICGPALDRLFEPFCQADASTTRRFGGTGLGLSISRRLARLLGGDILATSQEGVGSTFDLVFPVSLVAGTEFVGELPSGSVQIQPDEATAQTLSASILLVEDGADNQRLLVHILERAGATVTLAEHGGVALERIRAGDRFDLILMDMQMPVLDGYAATRAIRELGVATPIVALTAHAMADDRQRCIDAGCDGFATKPVRRRRLLELVTEQLDAAARLATPRQRAADEPGHPD